MFSADLTPVVNQFKSYLEFGDMTEAIGQLVADTKTRAQWIVMSPPDFYNSRRVFDSGWCFDQETNGKLIAGGIVGYMFGAVVITADVPRGEVYVSATMERELIFSENERANLRKVVFRVG